MKSLNIMWIAILFIIACPSCKKDDQKPGDPGQDKKPEITSFTPDHGSAGSIIKITGKNFSTSASDNHVSFTGASGDAEITQATAGELTVKVPALAFTGKVTVKVGNQSVTSASNFTIDPGNVSLTDFTPKQGPFGTAVTITGKKFGEDIVVVINGIEAEVTSKSTTQIVFKIPANTSLTSHPINVVSDGTTLQTNDNFTVTASGAYAQWIKKNVNANLGSSIFQFGISFVYKNKIYWGFSKISFNQTISDYMVFDPSSSNPQWVLQVPPPADMAPPSLQSAVALVNNNKVYIGTGLAPSASKKWWEYDPETNTARALTDYPEVTANALSFIFNGNMYVGFGGSNNSLYRFNAAANANLGSWDLVATSMAREISNASAFTVGNEAFIGRVLKNAGGERRDFYKMSTTHQLTEVASIPGMVQALSTPSFTIGAKGYFVTDKIVWEYTPSANGGAWRVVINTATSPVIKHTATCMVNNIPVVYGWTASGELYEFASL